MVAACALARNCPQGGAMSIIFAVLDIPGFGARGDRLSGAPVWEDDRDDDWDDDLWAEVCGMVPLQP
jgi:hypothetical protein